MAEINLNDAKEALSLANGWLAFFGGVATAFIGIFIKLYRVLRRAEQTETTVNEFVKADIPGKVQRLIDADAAKTARIETLETIIPTLMDEKGVIAIFDQQVELVKSIESNLRREIEMRNSHVISRIDDMKSDINQINQNILTLVTRDKKSRPGDIE